MKFRTSSPPNEQRMHHRNATHLAPTTNSVIPRRNGTLCDDLHPLQALERYKAQHSQAIMLSESPADAVHRRYAIGYYSCPFQAGNRLHHFFNAMIWAIVTNRTLLWKYYDAKTCRLVSQRRSQPHHDRQICLVANTEAECEVVLHRKASWIPSLEEWAPKQLGSNTTLTSLSYWSTHRPPSDPTRSKVRWRDIDSKHQGVDLWTEFQIVDFPQMLGKDAGNVLGDEKGRLDMLATDSARDAARNLFAEGSHFTYGMLFREVFDLRPSVLSLDSTSVLDAVSLSNPFSIALHSRHSKPEDNGSDVSTELKCLTSLTLNRTQGDKCVVYLLSDRVRTLEQLTNHVNENLNCTAVVANHDGGHHIRGEHGPFAGADFFRDLDLASRARNGFAGSTRSSSSLLQEWIEYDRTIESCSPRTKGVLPPLPKLNTCKLPK